MIYLLNMGRLLNNLPPIVIILTKASIPLIVLFPLLHVQNCNNRIHMVNHLILHQLLEANHDTNDRLCRQYYLVNLYASLSHSDLQANIFRQIFLNFKILWNLNTKINTKFSCWCYFRVIICYSKCFPCV